MDKSSDHAEMASSPLLMGGTSSSPPLSLHDLLASADLLGYHDALKNVLKLRHAGDIGDTDGTDLEGIGMSRPEQKRLWREYGKHFPMPKKTGKSCGERDQQQKGFVLKRIRRKMFGERGGEAGDLVGKMKLIGERDDPEEEEKGKDRRTPSKSGEQHQQHIIPADRITLCKEIGSGEFGHVFQAAWQNGTEQGEETVQVAVKRIIPEKLISQHSSFLQEAAIMTRMQNENVIRLYGVVLDTKAVMLVSELAPCGSLLECLQCPSWREPFSALTLSEFALQIAHGMRYLSSQRLIHRDLAARNVLVCTPTKVKISDFGLSRSLGHGEDYYRSEFSPTMKLPIAWCAPECINFLRFTSASDVWAYAVCLWEMFSYGKTPWEGMSGSQILHTIDTQRKKLACPAACPRDVYSSVMLRCWEWEVDKRPSFEQICDQLPALMPPLLVTVAESAGMTTRRSGQLQYGRDETIVLLDKNPPAGELGFWLGVSKSGKVGLFRAEDTIAFLGAENPTNGDISAKVPAFEEEEKKKTKKVKKSKEKRKEEKERKKEPNMAKKVVEISEPRGDLRHTCHVGADGRSFGLLNVNKNDLAKALPPKISPRSPQAVESNCSFPPFAGSDRSPSSASSSAMLTSPIMSTSMISLAPPRPPKRENGARMTMDVMSRSVYGQFADHCSPSSAEYLNAKTDPPALPPKPPRFRPFANIADHHPSFAPSALSIISSSSNTIPSSSSSRPANPISTPLSSVATKEHPLIIPSMPSFPKFPSEEKVIRNWQKLANNDDAKCNKMLNEKDQAEGEDESLMKSEAKGEEDEDEEFLRPVSICCDHQSADHDEVKKKEDEEDKEEEKLEEKDEQRILQILKDLQQDLSEFSLCSLDNCSDGRALLDGDERRTKLINLLEEKRKREREESLERHGIVTGQGGSAVVGMNREEYERRADEERKKAMKMLLKRKRGDEADNEEGKRTSVIGIISSACRRAAGGKNEEEEEKRIGSEGASKCHLSQFNKEQSPKNDLNSEAYEAYKLLVQCGNFLKATPLISPTRAISSSNAKNGILVQNAGMEEKEEEAEKELIGQPKKIEYINKSLVGWDQEPEGSLANQQRKVPNGFCCAMEAEGKVRQEPMPVITAPSPQSAQRLPPPVPPKPKIRWIREE